LDHGLRAARLGYENLLVATPVTHLGGTSTPAHPAFHVEGRRGGYLVTARHLPRATALAHRAYLVVEGTLGSVLGGSAAARAAHRAVARMAVRGAWEPSPFGPTLDGRSGGCYLHPHAGATGASRRGVPGRPRPGLLDGRGGAAARRLTGQRAGPARPPRAAAAAQPAPRPRRRDGGLPAARRRRLLGAGAAGPPRG